MLVFASIRAAAVVALALSAYGLGAPVLGRLRPAGRGERAALAVTLGLGVLGTASLLLGLVGALTRISVTILVAAGVVLAAVSLSRRRADNTDRVPFVGCVGNSSIAIGGA